MKNLILRKIFLEIIFLIFLSHFTFIRGQEEILPETNDHILTLYVMNSIKPLNWESPSALMESTFDGYKAKFLHHRQYLLGHMIIRLESPLIGGTKYSAMVSTSMREKRILMLKEKIGLGILGVGMEGKLDSDIDILKELKFYSHLGKIAYVKYKISEEAARKIVLFIEGFSHSENGDLPPCSHYGGAFWPRYLNEGSGCTAYGMSMLDVAGLMGEEHRKWKVEVNIPMHLVGGELNQGKKVSKKEISKQKAWVNDNDWGQEYIHFSIYDPSLIYDWIMEKRHQTGGEPYIKDEENNMPGLLCDMSHIKTKIEDPIFIPRDQPSVFINQFNRKREKWVLK